MIPKVLHYCFGMAPDFGGKPWSLIHYVGVASAIRHIKPKAAYFYYEYEPSGPWWELTKPLVTPVKIDAPREIFGWGRFDFASWVAGAPVCCGLCCPPCGP